MLEVISIAHLLAAIFASWRLTELVTMDRITEPIRRRWPSYLWTCPRCVSVWAGLGATLVFAAWPWANWPLALAWFYLVKDDWVLAWHRGPVGPIGHLGDPIVLHEIEPRERQ